MPYRLLLYQVEVWRYWLGQQEKASTQRKSFRLPGSIKPITNFIHVAKGGAAMSLEQTLDSMLRKAKKEGRTEGKAEGKTEVAQKLLAMGLDASAIAAATGFSPEEVKRLGEKLP